MRVVKALCCAALMAAMFVPAARADEWNKKTFLTFSGPVQIPGATLPAGTYVFKLADTGDRHVVQVFDKSEKKIFATLLAIPNQRMEATDKPVIMFSERPSGTPQAVKIWYYPGERYGNEFVYPKSQAMRIAKATHQRVLAMNDDSSHTVDANGMSAMRSAQVGYFDEDGAWQAGSERVATSGSSAPAVTDNATPAPAPAPEATMAKAAPRRHLPRTASDLPLFELLSGIALFGAFGVRQLRKGASFV
jgi:hypothetical protein